MKKLFWLFICIFLVSCGEKSASISTDSSKGTAEIKISAQSVLSAMDNGLYRDGELIVKFRTGVVRESSLGIHKAAGAAVKKTSAFAPSLELVSLPKDLSVQDAVTLYMSNPNVLFAEPNYIRKPATIPNDTAFSQQWGLRNTGQFAGGTAGADIKATDAWNVSTGSRGVIIAVIDSGIDYNHPDLVENIWTNPDEICTNGIDDDGNGLIDDCVGWNFFDNNNQAFDDAPHGTHVAGIIGALGNNMLGISGVMWYVRMIPLKFIGYHADPADCGGDTNFCGSVFDEIEAIQYAISKGAHVINASYGDYDFSAAERGAIADANAAGILFVAAAGNNGINNNLTPMYPASYDVPNIISVAASDQNDQRAAFSNFGSTSVDVAAPGVYILSTIPAFIAPNGYDFFNGTSMAAPHVSGLGGLLFGYYPHFNQHQVVATILRNADLIPSMIGSIGAAGRINAYRAISSLQTPESLSAVALSTSSILATWADKATAETGYVIERRTGGGAYSQIASLPANTTSYTDTGLADGTLYFYRIKAFNDIPADGSFAEISAATLISPPTGLAATAPSNTNVLLTWADNSGSENGYRIERKSKYTDYAEIATVGANVTSYNDTTVVGTTRYYYRVRAFNATGNSDYSNEAAIRPRGSGGGGGCSIGGGHNTPSAVGNLAVMLLPLAVIVLLRRRV